MKSSPTFTAVLISATLGLTSIMAQDGPPPEVPTQTGPLNTASASQPAPPPGGPGNPDTFRQRMNERIKTALKATDEEWAIIQPLLDKVQEKQREVMNSRMAGLFGGERGERRGNRGGGAEGNRGEGRPDANRPQRPSVPEISALKAALENDATSAEEIKAKLEAVRAARKKATAELDAASEELRKVLTMRQEALLIMMGILQ